LRGLFTVNVTSEDSGRIRVDSRDLFLIAYGDVVEVLTHEEVSDNSNREWLASPDDPTTPTEPISYYDSFVQLGPGEHEEQSSLSFTEGLPFASVDTTASDSGSNSMPKESQITITATVTGRFRYEDYSGVLRPIANAKVSIWDDDGASDDHLGNTTTDIDGYFSKTVSGSDA